jgi:hypothetical protein
MPHTRFFPRAAFAAGTVVLAMSACKPGHPSGSGELSCESVAAAVQAQFHLAAVSIRCTERGERTAFVDVVDAPLVQKLQAAGGADAEAAAAELVARSVWARAGIPLRLASVAVTLSATPGETDPTTMYTFGRGLVSYWQMAAEDTTRETLRP